MLATELKKIDRRQTIDVVVGIPFYNEKETLAQVVTTAVQGLSPFLNVKPLILCVGDPAGKEALASLTDLSLPVPHHQFLLAEGINGRGFSIRAILEVARELAADAVLLEADLREEGSEGFKPSWLERLYFPLLQDYDLVSGCFRRHYFEDPTGSLFVGPMLETFFGLKLRDPLSGVYGISRRLVEDYCTDLDWWYGGVGGYGVDPWLVAQAVVWKKKICEVSLGSKIGPPTLTKRAYVFKQVAQSLFDCIKTNEDYWLRSQLILKQPDIYGLEARDRAPAFSCHLEDLVASFSQGLDQYSSLLAHVLPEKAFAAMEKAAFQSGRDLVFSDRLWTTAVYHFLQTYAFDNTVKAEDIFEGLRIVYDGRIASFVAGVNKFSNLIGEVKHLDQEDLTYEQVDRLKRNQVAEFLDAKSGFIKTWVERAAEVRPVITPLDYLEFIPGVPLALPKDLKGIGGLPVRTNAVFRRLEERYSQEFHRFIHEELGLSENLTSEKIGAGLEEFMTKLEQIMHTLLPGDLATAEGTRQVVDQVLTLIPHKRILAVKEEVLRQLLTEFPPPNLLIRLGYTSTAELLSHLDVRDALALAGISEEREYTDRLLWWLGDNLRPDSLEEVDMRPLIFTPETFPGVGELRDISHFDRLAARITVSNLPKGLGGLFPKLRYLTHIAKTLVEAEHYSFIWQIYARERKGFGLKLVNSVIKHRGREVFSATNIFQNWHQRELTKRLQLVAQDLKSQEQLEEARFLELMAKGYGLGLTLGDGTFIPCSAWTWASYSFRGGKGIPTPLSVRIERDWFHHDLLEEIYKEMGFRPQDIMVDAINRIGEGRESESLLDAVLRGPVQEEVVLVQDVGSYPPAGQLRRHKLNPLLEPIQEHYWENRYVLNAATVRLDGKVYVLYRAFGEDEVSRIGLAIFDGAQLLERLPEPIFGPVIPEESHGCEDPRVVVIGDQLYMVYTAYNGIVAQVAAATILVDDFLARRFDRFRHLGLAFPGLWDKDAVLFPEKVGGRWVMYHRVEPSIWVSYADELKFPWPKQNHKIIIGPRSGLMWDSLKIGSGSQPIKTKYGWLLIYHGVSSTMVYRLGVILVDIKDPGRLLYRSPNPVLSPETEHEMGAKGRSWVPNVVFTCGAVPGTDKEVLDDDDEILCYYGASDTYLCLASATVAELIPEAVRRRIARRR
ncbi:MAG: glycosidase [Firmicutes bacterium]|nr:glycosidase [Bacillota bacterium]